MWWDRRFEQEGKELWWWTTHTHTHIFYKSVTRPYELNYTIQANTGITQNIHTSINSSEIMGFNHSSPYGLVHPSSNKACTQTVFFCLCCSWKKKPKEKLSLFKACRLSGVGRTKPTGHGYLSLLLHPALSFITVCCSCLFLHNNDFALLKFPLIEASVTFELL